MNRLLAVMLVAMGMLATSNVVTMAHNHTCVQAQDNRKQFDPEAFRKDMESYIKHHASLTDDEAAAAMPLLREMHDQMRKANEEARGIRKGVNGNSTEAEARQALDKILALGQRESALRTEFMNKIAVKVGPAKAISIMKAEDRFHREMFRNGAREQAGRQAQGRGQSHGEGRGHGKNQKK